ncbi:unannotated protein [freshwater metagenome]|uniref:Unannotated protein n=1 Tax=freshwater metagenome TaxID=449393 RepID=A0A6J7E352_9ZZZZ
MCASEDERVHLGVLQGCEIGIGDSEQFLAASHPRLDKLDKPRACDSGNFNPGIRDKRILIRTRFDGSLGSNNPDTF